MVDRPVRLDISVGSHGDSQGRQANADAGQEPPSEEQIAHFRSIVRVEDGAAVEVARDRHDKDKRVQPGTRARGPFDLFGPGNTAPSVTDSIRGSVSEPAVRLSERAATVPDQPPEIAWKLVGNVADRILVSADDRHEAQVFIRNDVLPGVTLRMGRADGRWVVDFMVSDAASFSFLAHAGSLIATELAERLKSSIEVRLAPAEDLEAEHGSSGAFFADPPALYGESSPLHGVRR